MEAKATLNYARISPRKVASSWISSATSRWTLRRYP